MSIYLKMRGSSRRLGRTAATSAAVAVAVLGTTLATAPAASAVDSSGCSKNIANHYRIVHDLAGATIRSGPAQGYSKRYHLNYGEYFLAVCTAKSSAGNLWYYGKDLGDRKGWVVASRTIRNP
ncbi:hypothetical protein ABZS76_14345 [Streptomyces sp. NPDC005562]|uniref:hypothetical protein n=2 Tax=Streptomyces TaxID=1883 RepID=UPI0033A176E9